VPFWVRFWSRSGVTGGVVWRVRRARSVCGGRHVSRRENFPRVPRMDMSGESVQNFAPARGDASRRVTEIFPACPEWCRKVSGRESEKFAAAKKFARKNLRRSGHIWCDILFSVFRNLWRSLASSVPEKVRPEWRHGRGARGATF